MQPVMPTNKEYPFDFVLVNLNKLRVTAFIVMLLCILYIFSGTWAIPLALIIDFALRAFNKGRFSFINGISDIIIDFSGMETLPMNEAPKRFAAKIGLLIATVILITDLTGFATAALVFAVVLAVFAFLESVIGFCAGCHLYSLYTKLFNKK